MLRGKSILSIPVRDLKTPIATSAGLKHVTPFAPLIQCCQEEPHLNFSRMGVYFSRAFGTPTEECQH